MTVIKAVFRWLWIVIKRVLRSLWIAYTNVVDITVYASFMLLFWPFAYIWPSFYWEFDSWLFREILRTIGYWIWTAGYDIVEYGDSPFSFQNDRCLVVVNHQSTADVPLMCSACSRKGVGGGKVAWILDSGFKWSNFGFVCKIRGDFFITQGRDTRVEQSTLLAKHMRKTYWTRDRRWFVIFPEGGFLHNRLETSRNYARKHGFPELSHVTLPRIYGVRTMLDTANPLTPRKNEQVVSVPPSPPGPGFRYLLDVTIGYPDGVPLGMDDIAFGIRPPCEVGIHYRRIPIQNVPYRTETELRDFLYELFAEKEKKLAHFNRYGHFPGIPRAEGVVVEYHKAGLIFNHVLFLVMFVFITKWIYVPIYTYLRSMW